MKLPQKRNLFMAAAVAVLAATIAALLLTASAPKPLGTPEISSELSAVEALSFKENYSYNPHDLDMLESLLSHDPLSSSYGAEIRWMFENNETEHIPHTTTFLRNYLRTGVDIPCLPQEIEHIALFVKHSDYQRASAQANELRSSYSKWLEDVRKRQKAYPQFYLTLEALLQQIDQTLPRLEQHQFDNETLAAAQEIGEAGVC